MNFYKRYMADYAKMTAQLTLVQHGAYTLLLDEIYSTERPLPADYPSLFRICRAMEKSEQVAVKFVADKHFPIDANGLRGNQRAFEEITDAKPAMEAARLNGAKGGRPKKEPIRLEVNNPVGFENETKTKPNAKPSHISDISTNVDIKKNKQKSISTPLPENFGISERVTAWAIEKGHTRLTEHLEDFTGKAKAKGYTYTNWDEAFMNAIRNDWAGLNKPKSGGFTSQNTHKYAAAGRAIFGDDEQAPVIKHMGEVIDV